MKRITEIVTVATELRDELAEIKSDLARLQSEARAAKDWRKELAILDRRLRLVELRVREVKDHNIAVMNVNFDVDAKTAERMATAFLARQRILKSNGESSE